jgi:hypothetical protein
MKFKGLGDWFEIFKGGTQIDSEGREHDGDKVIDKAVATFDAAQHEPPLVVGHPKENDPSYGWVEALKTTVKDGIKVLLAKAKQVVPEFEEMVKQGRFKKRSASFYPDGRLRHIGFLGAAPPAVKGLADLKFESDSDQVVFEFAATDEEKEAQKKRSQKYEIAIKEGGHVTKPKEWQDVPDDQFLDPVNYRYPCPNADQTRAAASYWGREDNQAQYTTEERSIMDERLDTFKKKFKIGEYRKGESMGNFKEKFKGFLSFMGVDMNKVPDEALPDNAPEGASPDVFTEADLEKARAEAKKDADAEYAEKDRQNAKKARDKEISDWAAQGVKEGKLLPAWVDSGLVAFAQSLDAEQTIQFTEGDEGKKSQLEWLKDFFEAFHKSPIFKEIATKAGAGEAAEFAEAKKAQEVGESIAAKVNPPDGG